MTAPDEPSVADEPQHPPGFAQASDARSAVGSMVWRVDQLDDDTLRTLVEIRFTIEKLQAVSLIGCVVALIVVLSTAPWLVPWLLVGFGVAFIASRLAIRLWLRREAIDLGVAPQLADHLIVALDKGRMKRPRTATGPVRRGADEGAREFAERARKHVVDRMVAGLRAHMRIGRR